MIKYRSERNKGFNWAALLGLAWLAISWGSIFFVGYLVLDAITRNS